MRSEGELGIGRGGWLENEDWVAERRVSRRRGGLGRRGRDREVSVSLDERDMRLLEHGDEVVGRYGRFVPMGLGWEEERDRDRLGGFGGSAKYRMFCTKG